MRLECPFNNCERKFGIRDMLRHLELTHAFRSSRRVETVTSLLMCAEWATVRLQSRDIESLVQDLDGQEGNVGVGEPSVAPPCNCFQQLVAVDDVAQIARLRGTNFFFPLRTWLQLQDLAERPAECWTLVDEGEVVVLDQPAYRASCAEVVLPGLSLC